MNSNALSRRVLTSTVTDTLTDAFHAVVHGAVQEATALAERFAPVLPFPARSLDDASNDTDGETGTPGNLTEHPGTTVGFWPTEHQDAYRLNPDRTVTRYRLACNNQRRWQVLHVDTLDPNTTPPTWSPTNSEHDYLHALATYQPDNTNPAWPTPNDAVTAYQDARALLLDPDEDLELLTTCA